MKRPNEDIRRAMGAKGIKQWELAEEMKILECNLSRKLRKELPESEKEKLLKIIEEMEG